MTLKIVGEAGRYLIVGGLAFVADFSLLYGLTEWAGWQYLISATIAFSVGFLVNYSLSILWVFRYRRFENKSFEFLIFLSVGLGGLLWTDAILAILSPVFGEKYLVAKMIAVIVVFMWNFLLRRQLLFVEKARYRKGDLIPANTRRPF